MLQKYSTNASEETTEKGTVIFKLEQDEQDEQDEQEDEKDI